MYMLIHKDIFVITKYIIDGSHPRNGNGIIQQGEHKTVLRWNFSNPMDQDLGFYMGYGNP